MAEARQKPAAEATVAIDRAFTDRLGELRLGPARGHGDPVRDGSALTVGAALELFAAQMGSRHLDLTAKWLRERGQGFYTIGSSGHEGNAAVAAALRPTDPALLHYRSGAFYLARAAQAAGSNGLMDVLLGLCGAADEPIAGGRHKVFGNRDLSVIPQTSTIASHLPRAVGVAFSIANAAKRGLPTTWPRDSVVVCSFGDASANHSTAVGAINAAAWCAWQHLPLPLLLVCEDNGLGISVRTPAGWVAAAYANRPGLRYFSADGTDLAATYDAARAAAEYVRTRRAPAFLHLSVVRYLGHAGSDVEVAYRPRAEIAAEMDRDPLLSSARQLVAAGALTPNQVLQRYEQVRRQVRALAEEAMSHPRLTSSAQIMAPLAPRRPAEVARAAAVTAHCGHRSEVFGGGLPEDEGPLTLSLAINRTLTDIMASDPTVTVFGEDVGLKGGVYGVTRGLQRRFGPARVFDTLLDEQTILGLANGAAISGLLPIPEIQYLAYLHNAEDQVRGEAASLSFFSTGQYRNPQVIRIAGLAYQKGFGVHFHNDNAVGVLRDVPGLVIAVPARADDAAGMLRTCVAAARIDGTVSVFLEPIALYHTRDLYEPGDGQWLAAYPPPGQWPHGHIPIGRARGYGESGDLALVTFGNGVPMSLRVARRLAKTGYRVRVIDLRWLAPLPIDDLLSAAAATDRVLVVDETRRSGGVAEGIIAALADSRYRGQVARVTSHDSFIPLGDAALDVLVRESDIEHAARELLGA